MTAEQLVALAVFAFVTSVTPGPNNLMLMASGANHGFARTVPHMLGVSIGFTAMILLIGLGLAGLFVAFPAAYGVLKAVSVAYLLWLAWKIATAPPPGEKGAGAQPFTFLQAALFQWVNPKAWTMALSAITAYAPADNRLTGLIVTAIVFGLINLPTVGSWTLLGTQLRRLLSTPLRLRAFNATAAALLVASLYPILFEGA